MKYRTVKLTPEGSLAREKVRDAVRGIHVIPVQGDRWQVKTLGLRRVERTFPEKSAACSFAEDIGRERGSKVIVHGSSEEATAARRPATSGRRS